MIAPFLGRLALCAALAASGPETPATDQPPSSAPDARLSSLSWMSGSWGAASGSRFAEEHWSDPRGGLMLGVHRDLEGEKAAFFEFLRIEQRGRTVAYVASPRGQCPAVVFWLAAISPERVVFENPAHDYPQRIVYWKEGGSLRARTEDLHGGKPQQWTWPPHRLAP